MVYPNYYIPTNSVPVYYFPVVPGITYSISGGADADLFQIDENTGVLSFIAAPDYEIPGDADGDNIYIVEVTATDGTLSDVQTIYVTVTDVLEGGGGFGRYGGSYRVQMINRNVINKVHQCL